VNSKIVSPTADTPATLIYIHDPMCSWCWAFAPVWQAVVERLPNNMHIKYLVGGLAPDTDETMPLALQQKLQGIWQQIQQRVPGTEFNFEFWKVCTPRRATYSACRAVLAAKKMNPEKERAMIKTIQKGYYLQARNPSEHNTLIDFAEQIGLDRQEFSHLLVADEIQKEFQQALNYSASLPINGFPSLVLQSNEGTHPIAIDYHSANNILGQLNAN